MKIKRFYATDMRAAFRLVREEQGPNAVILSSRRIDGGVEVIAATDYDEALVQQALKATLRAPEAANPAVPPTTLEPVAAPAPQRAAPRAEVDRLWAEDPNLRELRRELSGIRSLVEREAARARHDSLRNSPVRAKVLDELEGYGCDAALARAIAEGITESSDLRRARGHALGSWAKSIPAVGGDIAANGGVFALIGPTGVGKTTTIAKLAARFVRKASPRDVALVTTDTYRIGARDQLHTFGRLLGVPVFEAGSADALTDILARLYDYKLVLIDTAGMSHRDKALSVQLAWIGQINSVRPLLVLPANAQSSDLDDAVRRFRSARPEAVVLTKIDETGRLGTSLSVVVRQRVPLAYVTDGQRVPEDLHLAEPHRLVLRASELKRDAVANEIEATETASAAA
jgi:flagellar biosynthesis protein FlhF